MDSRYFIVILLLWLFYGLDARACSMCSCGDPSGELCTGDFDSEMRWTFKVESRYTTKQNDSDEGLGTEHHRQTQLAAAADVSFANAFELYARIPVVTTTLWTTGTGADERVSNSGVGDAEAMGRYLLPLDLGNSHFTVALGMKMPTGNNELVSQEEGSEGDRLTEHAQLGTGSWDGYSILRWCHSGWITSMVSFGYRFNGVNDYGQRYGRTAWAEATGVRNVSSVVQIKTGLRFRNAARDDTQEGRDENSGGGLLSALVECRASLGAQIALYANGDIPVLSDLNGTQIERPILGAGLTFSP